MTIFIGKNFVYISLKDLHYNFSMYKDDISFKLPNYIINEENNDLKRGLWKKISQIENVIKYKHVDGDEIEYCVNYEVGKKDMTPFYESIRTLNIDSKQNYIDHKCNSLRMYKKLLHNLRCVFNDFEKINLNNTKHSICDEKRVDISSEENPYSWFCDIIYLEDDNKKIYIKKIYIKKMIKNIFDYVDSQNNEKVKEKMNLLKKSNIMDLVRSKNGLLNLENIKNNEQKNNEQKNNEQKNNEQKNNEQKNNEQNNNEQNNNEQNNNEQNNNEQKNNEQKNNEQYFTRTYKTDLSILVNLYMLCKCLNQIDKNIKIIDMNLSKLESFDCDDHSDEYWINTMVQTYFKEYECVNYQKYMNDNNERDISWQIYYSEIYTLKISYFTNCFTSFQKDNIKISDSFVICKSKRDNMWNIFSSVYNTENNKQIDHGSIIKKIYDEELKKQSIVDKYGICYDDL
jgi:hypothetical protein